MKKLWREPLLHFLALGAVLFSAFEYFSPSTPASTGRIHVTRGDIEHLHAGFQRLWNRPATTAELNELIQDYVREEICYREALTLGLDQDDQIIRRRLRQKLEFLSEGFAGQEDPTDAQLEAFVQEQPGLYRIDARVAFHQIYLNPDTRGTNLAMDAQVLLQQLANTNAPPDLATLGDSILLPKEVPLSSESLISRQFGSQFAKRLLEVDLDRWTGPIESGFGWHLVRVQRREEERMPPLADIRAAVARDWQSVRQQEALENFYQSLRKRYTVSVEEWEAPTTNAVPDEGEEGM